ncbi:hypothetical protein B0H67DRAFT_491713 [Lasiosphaeris hirsuta]|uniref:C3H1-type domain-containing protein n=1 Tax=Lasiosphaeris hirsuta TaxID=260670 RepID=A0AA40A9X3_9PEZI|nr:hypothetical protein B0H67DRAFT_491713 [Lasiosphaeris hirsuta]
MSGSYDDFDNVDPAEPYITPLANLIQLEKYRAQIEGNIKHAYEDLMNKYREKCADFEREKRNAQVWEREQRFVEKELTGIKSKLEASGFVFVIIDGDGVIFHESLIAEGEEGGKAAAHELYQQLKRHMYETYNMHSVDIMVQLVLSVEGLTKALHASNTLRTFDPSILARFARGFCRAQPFFTVVDVGYGKEQADNKVRKVFELMEKNLQCRMLILGGCHDNGYATFLESFRNNHKVVLLETTPAAADFRKLSFPRLSLPTVFRSEPLPSKVDAFPSRAIAPPPGFNGLSRPTASPAPLPASSLGQITNGSPRQAPAVLAPPKPTTPVIAEPTRRDSGSNGKSAGSSWASVGRSSGVQIIDISSKKASAKERAFYLLNKNNERIDIPLPKLEPAAQTSFDNKTKKNNGVNFCNRFHLTGHCKQSETTGYCPYVHGERLSAAEQVLLKIRARHLPCGSASHCWDISCTLGHHCANGSSCFFGDGCRFADTHGMDTTPTIKIFEDGTREVIVSK